MMPKKSTIPTAKEGPLEVLLKWVVPPDLETKYATNVVVQRGEHGEFVLSFFDQRRPIILGSPEEVQEKWSKVKEVDAVCVSRVVFAPLAYVKFVRALVSMLPPVKSEEAEGDPSQV